MVSSTINLSRQRAEVIIVNIYSFFMCFFYAVGVYAFLKYFYPSYKNQISAYVSNHKELVGGLTVTTALSVATEILTRIINSAVWSASLDNFSGALVAVLLPQGFIFFMGTCVNICCHIIYLKKPQASNSTENKPAIQLRIQRTCTIEQAPAGDSKQTTENQAPAGDSKETTDKQGTVSVPKQNAEKRDSKRTGEIEVINLASDREEAEHETINLINDPLATESNNNRGNLGFFIGHCDAIATRFSHDINVHIILPLTLTAYGIIYTAFPTFVLMVAYPTQVIMIVPTAIALLFATIIFSAIMFKLLNYKLSKLLTRPEKIVNTIKFVVCRYIPFYVAVLLLKSVAVIFLYLLIIARGSIGTGLLLTLILSILPTALISGISWIAKKSLLDKKKKESSEESGNQPPRAAERQSSNQ